MAAGDTHILTEAGDFLQTEANGVDDNHILQEGAAAAAAVNPWATHRIDRGRR